MSEAEYVSVPKERYMELLEKEKKYDASKKRKKKDDKRGDLLTFGEYRNVKLSEAEYERLSREYGADADEAIKILDEYIENKGDKYKNHNLTIRSWVMDAVGEQKIKRAKMKDEERRYGIGGNTGLNFDLSDIFECPRAKENG